MTHSFAARRLPSPSGSQFLPDRRQTSLRSVAGGEPHALLFGSSLRPTGRASQEVRTFAPHCRRPAARFTLTPHTPEYPRPLFAVRGQKGVRRSAPHAFSNAPPTAPNVGGVQDWLGIAAMGLSFRTSAHGSLTVGYRLAAPRRHPTFATAKPAHPALRSFPLRPAPQSGSESAYACGYGSLSTPFA